MCNTKLSKRQGGRMDIKVFEKILTELKTVGVDTVALHTVAETFMYKDLDSIVNLIESNNFNLWVSSNAQFPDKIRELYDKFPNTAHTYRLSIDGATKDTYEFIRKGGSFSKVIESLEEIHKINNGKINKNITLSIDVVVSTTNFKEIPDFFNVFTKYCFPESINFHLINGVSPDSSYFEETFPYKNLIKNNIPCSMVFKNFYFTFDGKVTVCCRDYEAELTVGSIKDKLLVDILEGEKLELIRKQHLGDKKLTINSYLNCYIPHKMVISLFSDYIQYLYFNQKLELIKENILSFLEKMNEVFGSNDKDLIIKTAKEFYSK